jgi:hypothetical protein
MVTCPECDGDGTISEGIECASLDKTHKNYFELAELKSDALRVISQTNRLKELKPERSGSYNEQMITTLAEINRQANKLLNSGS